MVGRSFKQGYACEKCIPEGYYGRMRRTPLYERHERQYKYSGYVVCPHHGIQKGVALKDL